MSGSNREQPQAAAEPAVDAARALLLGAVVLYRLDLDVVEQALAELGAANREVWPLTDDELAEAL